MTTGLTINDQRTTTYEFSYLHGSAIVSSITNNLGFGISKYYEDNRNLIVGVSNYFDEDCISSFIYQNDALGRRSQRVDKNIDYSVAKTNSFAYNGYSEVANAVMNTNNYNFTYDNIGNMLRNQCSDNEYGCLYSFYNLNTIYETFPASGGNDMYQYDQDGNMIGKSTCDFLTGYPPVWAYTWNGENRMTTATNCVDGTYITYSYDYQGRMIKKVTDGETTLFYWSGNNIIAEIGESETNYYTWANGETLTASLDGETVFYCHDANKNTTDLVDDTGDIVAHYEYSPFGVITDQSDTTLAEVNPFRFSNEYFDATTGFVEYEQRKYLPALGKFMSRDPIGGFCQELYEKR